jgi:hypothetical protein
MDEQPVQLLGEKREAMPMNEKHGKWEDNEYVRKGTRSVFIFVEPLGGKRYVCASLQRTVRWQFTTEDARIKLQGLYPNF